MKLKTFVKVGNVSNLSDARYCAGFGVNMIGFNLDPTKENAIPLETAKEIMGWVAGVDFVLEFGTLPLDQIKTILNETDTGAAQVDCLETAKALAGSTAQVLLSMSIQNTNDLIQLKDALDEKSIDYVVIDTPDESLHADIETVMANSSSKALRAYDVTPENVEAKSNFTGISLSGSQEEIPGFKDYDELADIFEVLEEFD